MPRSSGGGSHSGGSHGGSHSSHRSSGGGSHSGGGRSSRPTISTTRYHGSQRYVYYGRHHTPHYVYCNKDPRKAYRPRWGCLILYLPILFGIFFAAKEQLVHVPKKIEANKSSTIIIDDGADVIKDEAKLEASLREFYDETGVTPAVITVYNDEWDRNYNFMENFAYDLYVNLFNDEYHWLIVYTQKRGLNADDFNDWDWEGMIGTQVGSMITLRDEDLMQETMQRNLTASSRYSVGDAIAGAFSDTLEQARKTYVDWNNVKTYGGIMLFLLFHMSLMIGITPKSIKYWRSKPAPETEQEIAKERTFPNYYQCPYCNGSFIPNEYNRNCPYCGAAVNMAQTANTRNQY